MSFDLSVDFEELPSNLSERWTHEFKSHGFDLEFHPNFDHTAWKGGFVPVRVRRAPNELIRFILSSDALSGFELYLSRDSASFRTAFGRSTLDIVLQCLGAALLASITGGTYIDPQSDIEAVGSDAIEPALTEIAMSLDYAKEEERSFQPFTGWQITS
jgi:hypothetical protein